MMSAAGGLWCGLVDTRHLVSVLTTHDVTRGHNSIFFTIQVGTTLYIIYYTVSSSDRFKELETETIIPPVVILFYLNCFIQFFS